MIDQQQFGYNIWVVQSWEHCGGCGGQPYVQQPYVADLTVCQAVCLEESIGGDKRLKPHLYSTAASLSRCWSMQSCCVFG